MKIQIKKDVLQKGIQIVQNIITTKNVLPILSNILIETVKTGVKLTATDLDISISVSLDAEVQEAGSITIPAKRFNDVIRELPEGEINVVVKKNNVVYIRLESCEFKLMGLAKDEFPKPPELKDGEVVEIEQVVLKEMLQLTSFAVSHEETRYILNGLLFEVKKHPHKDISVLRMVATDARRLALTEKTIDTLKIKKEIAMIIPLKSIQELMRNIKEDGNVSIIAGANQACFELENIIIISRLIEGEFPDYKRVIPLPQEKKIKIDKQQFLLALRRANLLSTPDSLAVKIEITKNKMIVSKTTPEIGESREELGVDYLGKEFITGFNPNYLIDVLRNMSGAFIEIELSEPEKPAVIRTEDYVYLVQPMRLS